MSQKHTNLPFHCVPTISTTSSLVNPKGNFYVSLTMMWLEQLFGKNTPIIKQMPSCMQKNNLESFVNHNRVSKKCTPASSQRSGWGLVGIPLVLIHALEKTCKHQEMCWINKNWENQSMPGNAIFLIDTSICWTIVCVTSVVDIASIRIKFQPSSKWTTMVMFLPSWYFLEAH